MTIPILRIFVLLLVSSLLVSCSRSSEELKAEDIKAEIVEYGLYKHPGEKIIVPAPDTPTGYKSKPKNGKKLIYIEQTDTIKMKKGMIFGYKVKLENLPDNRQPVFTLRYSYPPMTTYDGKTSTGFELKQIARPTGGKVIGGIYYMLSEDHEMVPGEWNLAVVYKDTVIVDKIFVLVK